MDPENGVNEQGCARIGALTSFVLVNAIITLAFVIAPADSAATHLANMHKLVSLLLGLAMLAFALWKKRYGLLFFFSVLQFAVFIVVLQEVNSLPI